MNRLGRYALYWLAASVALALIGRSRMIRRVPLHLIGAAVTGRALRANDLQLLAAPKKKTRHPARRGTSPRRRAAAQR